MAIKALPAAQAFRSYACEALGARPVYAAILNAGYDFCQHKLNSGF
ncbi:MAG: hypothetical protein ABI367_02560 [Mucilaginibacter sp.]